MVRCRAKAVGTEVCTKHCGTGFTAYLEDGGTLEKARQSRAAHTSTRSTQLYDQRDDRVTPDEVMKINIRG